MDPRLIVKLGKRGKTIIIKSLCMPECVGCPLQFTPTPKEDDQKFCKRFINPEVLWKGFNPDGKPKVCLARVELKVEKEEKGGKPMNPLKASKRKVSQRPRVAVAAEATPKKKDKKKMERVDFR